MNIIIIVFFGIAFVRMYEIVQLDPEGYPITPEFQNYKYCVLDRLFIQSSYGGYMPDPCIPMPCSKSRERFIGMLLVRNVSCDASWCVNTTSFACSPGNYNCPQVEHIIDQNQAGSEFDGFDKCILGNMIMAYGKWNNHVGTMSGFKQNWTAISHEKRQVYGELFESAQNYVIRCSEISGIIKPSCATGVLDVNSNCSEISVSAPQFSCSQTLKKTTVNILDLVFILICVTVITIFLLTKYYSSENVDYKSQTDVSFEMIEISPSMLTDEEEGNDHKIQE